MGAPSIQEDIQQRFDELNSGLSSGDLPPDPDAWRRRAKVLRDQLFSLWDVMTCEGTGEAMDRFFKRRQREFDLGREIMGLQREITRLRGEVDQKASSIRDLQSQIVEKDKLLQKTFDELQEERDLGAIFSEADQGLNAVLQSGSKGRSRGSAKPR